MLPGSDIGIKFYIYPDFSRLADVRIWSDAAGMIWLNLIVMLIEIYHLKIFWIKVQIFLRSGNYFKFSSINIQNISFITL